MWPPQRRIGQLLGGKYRVQQLLAVGGMGVIYGACHELTRRSVAVKLLRPELATRPELIRRVAVEARLAVEASHPNVVEVLDAGADDLGIPYVVLERLYGQPLEALIGERLSVLAAVQALMPVVNALVALHGASIVHRDIKPSNIFLSWEADRIIPKLLDFGIAKALVSADSTLSNVGLGTPFYMAPEQAIGCVTLGPATDVWSMAVVLFRCLTGRLPFAGLPERGPSALSFAFDPATVEHVPEPIGRVVARSLQLDPRDRFASMSEFRSALLEVLRQVDEGQSWPSETTVAYSTDEFALSSMLPAGMDSDRAASAGQNHQQARPADILTRTLARAWQTAHGTRRRRVALAVSIGLVSAAAAFVFWTREPALAPRAESVGGGAAALALNPAETQSLVDARAAIAPRPLLHAGTAPASTAREVELLGISAPVSASETNEVRHQRLRRARTPGPVSEPAALDRSQSDIPLGPNRSPIIE